MMLFKYNVGYVPESWCGRSNKKFKIKTSCRTKASAEKKRKEFIVIADKFHTGTS